MVTRLPVSRWAWPTQTPIAETVWADDWYFFDRMLPSNAPRLMFRAFSQQQNKEHPTQLSSWSLLQSPISVTSAISLRAVRSGESGRIISTVQSSVAHRLEDVPTMRPI